MSKKYTNIPRDIEAEDLKRAITQDASKQSGKPLLPLCNARILGPLILKHQTIKKPIEIRNCEFAGEVDLRYCEFEQVVNFSGCTFQGEFNSGDETESHTVYKKDLICNNATFKECVTAQFNGVRIEGSAYFRGTKFLNAKVSLDFQGGSVEKSLECNPATFKGPAKFAGLKCNGYGSFDGATFEKKAEFGLSSFGGHASFDEATFTGPVKFNFSSFSGNASFDRATFNKGPVSFNAIKCDGIGFFREAKFQLQSVEEATEEEGKVNATAAVKRTASELGVDLSNVEGTGRGGSITVSDVQDAAEVNFVGASFGANLEFQSVTSDRSVSFNSLACERHGFFWNAVFKGKKIDLSYASFGGNFEFDWAKVEGEADLQRLKCEGAGKFDYARFGRFVEEYQVLLIDGRRLVGEKVNLSSTRFGSLSLEGARFDGEVDMSAARISQNLTLGGTEAQFLGGTEVQFEQEVKLYDVSMAELTLKSPIRSFIRGKLDLRRCNFNQFSGPDETAEELELELALEFAKAQDQTKFSRDPYLQLEKYYNSIGDLAQAKQVYYEGRSEFRRNAKYRNKQTTGTRQWLRVKLTSWGDWWLKWLTGYGVQTERLLVPIFLAILMGFVFFSTSNALRVAEPTSSAASAELGKKTATPSSEGGGSESGKTRQAKDSKIEKAGFIDSVAYNVDLFLPVDLDVAAQWEPQGQLRETYVFVHSLAGWLLIPLLITSLGGIIRRQ